MRCRGNSTRVCIHEPVVKSTALSIVSRTVAEPTDDVKCGPSVYVTCGAHGDILT